MSIDANGVDVSLSPQTAVVHSHFKPVMQVVFFRAGCEASIFQCGADPEDAASRAEDRQM